MKTQLDSDQKIHDILETIDALDGIGFIEYRTEDNSVYLSPNCRQILDLPPHQNISASQIIHCIDEEFRQYFVDTAHELQTQTNWTNLPPVIQTECTITSFTGKKKWLRMYRKRSVENGFTVSKGFWQDISAEVQERIIAEQFQDLYDNAPYGYHTTFLDGRISDMNRTMLNYLGYTLQEVKNGLGLAQILTRESFRARMSFSEKLFRDGILRDFEAEFVRKDGSTFYGLVTATLVHNAAGEPMAIRAATVDLTERKRFEEHERKASIAEEANRVRAEFMNMLSHEFRTPLGIILGAADALKSFVDDDPRQFVHMIESGGNRLLTLLNNVLELAQTESDTGVATLHRTDILSFFRHIHEQWSSQIETRGIEYLLEFSPTLPQAILVDMPRLERILVCLLDNAFKFTENGFVRLVVNAMPQQHDTTKGTLHLRLNDTGIGIPEYHLQQVFEPFFQGHRGTTRQFDGAGIGLTVVRNLIQQLGGSVQISSRIGSGTTVTLAIPFQMTN